MKQIVDLVFGAALLLTITGSPVCASGIDQSVSLPGRSRLSSYTNTDATFQHNIFDIYNHGDVDAAVVRVNAINLPHFDMHDVKSTVYAFATDRSTAGDLAAAVPEPGTIVLLSAGILVLAVYCRRRMNGPLPSE